MGNTIEYDVKSYQVKNNYSKVYKSMTKSIETQNLTERHVGLANVNMTQ